MPRRIATVMAALVLLVVGAVPALAAGERGGHHRPVRPLVFVHGSSGSAAQFATQFQRFASNGYPQDRMAAYEYDTSVPLEQNQTQVLDGLEAFIDEVRAATGADQVDVAAHSRGTSVLHAYLATPERAAEVANYINLDGRPSATPPGGVRTLAVWGEPFVAGPSPEIGGAENVRFPDKAHTEVVTAAETFAAMYEFLRGRPPRTTLVVPQVPWRVTVAGRALLFPQNQGVDGAVVEVYEVDGRSGRRRGGPRATWTLDASGEWGPFRARGGRHYEFAVVQEGGVHHFAFQPFLRSDHFVRLNTARPGQGLGAFVEAGPDHSALTITRQREWWGDQPAGANDRLQVAGEDLVNAAIAPRARRVIGIFAFDRGSDRVSDLSAPLQPFASIAFISAGDVYAPASPDGTGTVPVVMRPRGAPGIVHRVNVANWPSEGHRISVQLRDDVQAIDSYLEWLISRAGDD